MIRWRSTRCFLAPWVTFEVQSDSRDVKRDLSLATWVPDPTEPPLDLWATILIIECVYLFYFLKFPSLVFTQFILHPTEERNIPRFGVRTKELWPSHGWGIKSNLIAIKGVLAQNWFKTARLLRTDDSMQIYTLFSSNLGHIWGSVELSWCEMGPIISHVGTGPNGASFRFMGH
jgi:hypothetical protein